MSEAAKDTVVSPGPPSVSLLVAIAAGGIGMSAGLMLEDYVLHFLHHIGRSAESIWSTLGTAMLYAPLWSLLVIVYAGIPIVFMAVQIYRWRLREWYYFLCAGLIAAFLPLLVFAIFSRFYAILALKAYGGGLLVGALTGSLAPWIYLRSQNQLPA